MLQNCTDVEHLYGIHNRLDLTGRWKVSDTSVGSLSLRERAGVRGVRTIKVVAATGSTPKRFRSVFCDSRSQREPPNSLEFNYGKCNSADNYCVFVSMYFDNAICTSHPRTKQLPQTVDNGFVMFQSPCR
jgi:hypothetical protein